MPELSKQLGEAGQQIGQIGGDALGEQLGELGKTAGSIIEWPTIIWNQWKLKAIITLFGIPIALIMANVQYFLANLVGFKIPKIFPEMPWWEIMIMGFLDFMLALTLFAGYTLFVAIGCNTVVGWFVC